MEMFFWSSKKLVSKAKRCKRNVTVYLAGFSLVGGRWRKYHQHFVSKMMLTVRDIREADVRWRDKSSEGSPNCTVDVIVLVANVHTSHFYWAKKSKAWTKATLGKKLLRMIDVVGDFLSSWASGRSFFFCHNALASRWFLRNITTEKCLD